MRVPLPTDVTRVTAGRPRGPRRLRWAAAAVIPIMASTMWFATPGGATTTSAAAPVAWTVYHGSPQGTGLALSVTKVKTTSRAWTSPALDGELYGEPLVSNGRVFVATEDDTVYSLSAATGKVVWSTHVATPVPSSLLPCGDIGPTVGITGTPVIDTPRDEIYAVADELIGGKPAHVLVGLKTTTGKLEMTRRVDPAGAAPSALLQRTGLTLDDGHVMFGYGGNDGDCASYRGRVVSVPVAGGTPVTFTVDAAAGESQGAVWMGGAAPVVDSKGNVWVETGNGSVYSSHHAYDDSDGVLELSSSLRLEQYFAPSSWPANNQQDLDMTTAPTLLSDGDVLVTGKSRIAYLLDGSHLGGIGGQRASLGSLCSDDIDGGIAALGTTVYLPCLSGTIAVRVVASPASIRLLWSSGTGGGPASAPPTVPSASRRRSVRRPTTSRRPASVTASCWPRPPIRWWPLPPPPAIRRQPRRRWRRRARRRPTVRYPPAP
ncbi:MAG: PQQ-binding-like beta-propeller repeat protein [Acidimicrobiales bacterium]